MSGGKTEFLQDCVARDVVYHNACFSNFRSDCQIPKMFRSEEPARKQCSGRHDNTRLSAFDNVIQYLDTLDSEQVTVRDLVDIMADHLKDCESEAYSNIQMKTELIKHCGDEILFAQSPNQADVITLKKTATRILRDFYKQPRNLDTEAEKRRVIKAAADIIHSDIKSKASSRQEYPDSTAIENHRNYIPQTLRQFLEQVIRKKDASLKISVIGQALVQSTWPNTVIAQMQIGLAVQMHRTFGSRFLIDTLSHLGFCTSYIEVRKFELNTAVFHGIDLPETTDKHTVQFVADNVDHKQFTATTDGQNTFHGMGMIAVVTPGVSKPKKIPRKKVTM